jgi:tetratricopeptide (TPR) repeat protein
VKRARLCAILVIAALAGGLPARAATVEETFERGAAAYREGKFEDAAQAYIAILEGGVADPRVFYNLGNVYFKQGRIGPAILEYERALRLDPADQDVRDNLDLARSQMRDRVPDADLQAPVRLVKDTIESTPPDVLSWAFLGFWWLTCVVIAGIPLVRSWIRRRFMAYGAGALALVAALFATALFYQMQQEAEGIAIVMADKVDVRSGPGEENTVLFTVHEGTRMEVRSRVEHWTQVSLPNGLSGWVPAESVEKV